MRQGEVADWARESWEASREFAYGSILADPCGAGRPPSGRWSPRRSPERLIPIVRRQVARGGLRLARLLDEALQPDSPWLTGARERGQADLSLLYSGTTVTARRFCGPGGLVRFRRPPGAPCPS